MKFRRSDIRDIHMKFRCSDIRNFPVKFWCLERVTNEKIMAVNEYSDTVLEEINKNHKEVLFLYDMLNDKHDNLKNTVRGYK